jgi:hypothetical protein
LLLELELSENSPIMLYYDNKVTINIANNHVKRDQTKYVKINHHFIKEKLDSKEISLVCQNNRAVNRHIN